jgi:hypothetical protein
VHSVGLTHVSLLSAQFRSPSSINRLGCVILVIFSDVKQNSLQVTRAVLLGPLIPSAAGHFPYRPHISSFLTTFHQTVCLPVTPDDSRYSIFILSVKQLLFRRSCGRYSSSHEAADQIEYRPCCYCKYV